MTGQREHEARASTCFVLGHSWKHVITYSGTTSLYECRRCPERKVIQLQGTIKLSGPGVVTGRELFRADDAVEGGQHGE